MPDVTQNAQLIEQELHWLQTIIDQRILHFIHRNESKESQYDTDPPAPAISGAGSYYANFIQKHALTLDVPKVVLLALAPEVHPELPDCFLTRNQPITYYKTYNYSVDRKSRK